MYNENIIQEKVAWSQIQFFDTPPVYDRAFKPIKDTLTFNMEAVECPITS